MDLRSNCCWPSSNPVGRYTDRKEKGPSWTTGIKKIYFLDQSRRPEDEKCWTLCRVFMPSARSFSGEVRVPAMNLSPWLSGGLNSCILTGKWGCWKQRCSWNLVTFFDWSNIFLLLCYAYGAARDKGRGERLLVRRTEQKRTRKLYTHQKRRDTELK